jgi:hypothetical protein
LRDPFRGWTDSLSAAGGISVLVGLGLVNFIRARSVNKFDIIPVDIVTNHILIATAYGAEKLKGQLSVYNCGSSHANSITMGGYKDRMITNFKKLRFTKQAFPVSLEFINDHRVYKTKKAVFEYIPDYLITKASEMPVIGTASLKK